MNLVLSTYCMGPSPLQDCMVAARVEGFSGLCLDERHLSLNAPQRKAEEAAAASLEAGLELSVYDPGVGRFTESQDPAAAFDQARRAADLASAAGCPRLVVHPSSRPRQPTRLLEALREEARWLRLLADSAQHTPLPVRICVCLRPQSLANDPFSAAGLLQWTGSLDVRLALDTAACFQARLDYSENVLHSVRDLLALVVLRDIQYGRDGSVQDVPFRQGIVNFIPLLARLQEFRFQGPLVLGARIPPDPSVEPRVTARREFRAAQELWQEMEGSVGRLSSG
ncbi:MAG: sugar phosphate isomerase/epimerase [Planctomycetes bacterium]|nr:sugar phosphate isomerase/epimerase [Planctomycetota bacterium]